MRRAATAFVLVLRFLRAVVVSGVQTVAVILRHGLRRNPPQPGFARLRFTPMSAPGAAVLGCMVSLTPGTTSVDVDAERGELLLHMLDIAQIDALAKTLRRDFEPGLLVLFGRSEP